MKSTALKKIARVMFWICLAWLIGLGVSHAFYKEPINEEFLREFDEFDAWEELSSDPITFKVSKCDSEVGYLVFESHYGYQSDITVATLLDTEGIITKVETYSQNETPSYYRKLIGGNFFKNNFVEQAAKDGFNIESNVDAISHATISSNAVTHAVSKGSQYVAREFLGQKVVPTTTTGIKLDIKDFALIGMFILVFVATRFSKIVWLQWFVRIYSIVMMGFVAAQFITLSVLVAFTTFDWPNISDYLRWYIMVFGVLILLFATGKNSYCLYMCPFGAFQELEFALAGNLAISAYDSHVSRYIRYVPPLLFTLAVALAFITHNLAFTNFEPFSLLFGQVGADIQWALFPLILIGALLLRRFYCKSTCPVGYALNKVVLARNKVVKKLWSKKSSKEKG